MLGRRERGLERRALLRRSPGLETLEARQLMAASIEPIADVVSPQYLGLPVPVDGGTGRPQAYSVTSSDPRVRATIAQGQFLTMDITHASSGASDPAFSGTLVFQLFADQTPLTVERISGLVNQGFYNGKFLFRIANNFPGANDYIVQGGSSDNTASGSINQPGFPFPDEFVRSLAFTGKGQLAMANSGRDTNGSQFFMTTGSPRFLDFKHTIFAQLVSGEDVLQQITQVALNGSTPVSPVIMSTVALTNTNPDGVVLLDTTQAKAGDTSTVTVTATDPADGSKATRTFKVTVSPDSANNSRPILGPVRDQTVGLNQVDVFQLTANNPEPNDPLVYTVQGGKNAAGTAFTPITNATATVDQATGVVRVTPNSGFTGDINLLVGVRDSVNRAGTGSSPDAPDNFDTEEITLTVTNGQAVNLQPIALAQSSQVDLNKPLRIQLSGDTANPASSQTLTYALASQPGSGTIRSFNPSTGTLEYVPNEGYIGPDAFSFTVTDVGAPTPNLTSASAFVNLTVNAATSSVRVFPADRTLVVTPPPRTDRGTNLIFVGLVGDQIQVSINGVVDATQPRSTDIDRIVVYGAKASDQIRIDTNLSQQVTLNGGLGGRNRLNPGGGPSRQHGWFGYNILRGGPSNDRFVGRAGHVKIRNRPVLGSDSAQIVQPNPGGQPPTGLFVKYRNNHPVVVHPHGPRTQFRVADIITRPM